MAPRRSRSEDVVKSGVGFSTKQDSRVAGIEAAEAALASLGRANCTMLVMTDAYDPEKVLGGVQSVVGASRIMGCLTPGVLTRDRLLEQGVGVLCASDENARAATVLRGNFDKDPFGSGQRAGTALLASGIRTGCVVVLPNGFGSGISELVRGLYDKLGPDFQYVGGGSGSNLRMRKSFQLTEEGIEKDGMAVAVLDGVSVESNLAHGWVPMGDPVVITRAVGKKVLEMNGYPAFSVYSRQLGGVRPEDFLLLGMKHPLGFPDMNGQYVIRDPIGVNADQSIDFISEVPSNAVGYVMRGEVNDLVKTAGQVAASIAHKVCGNDAFAVLFDCVSRSLLMGKEFGRELATISNAFTREMPLMGMLSLGEVAGCGHVPSFHNKTTVVAVGGMGRDGDVYGR